MTHTLIDLGKIYFLLNIAPMQPCTAYKKTFQPYYQHCANVKGLIKSIA